MRNPQQMNKINERKQSTEDLGQEQHKCKGLEFSLTISLIFIYRVPTKIIKVILGCNFRCLLSITKKAVIPVSSALVRKYLEWIQQQNISNYILQEKVKKLVMFSLKKKWLRDSMVIAFKYLNACQMKKDQAYSVWSQELEPKPVGGSCAETDLGLL